jgi:hypothetical protein
MTCERQCATEAAAASGDRLTRLKERRMGGQQFRRGPVNRVVDRSLELALRFAPHWFGWKTCTGLARMSTQPSPLVARFASILRRTMKTKVTNIYSAADGIRDEAESLRSEVLGGSAGGRRPAGADRVA